MLKLEISRRVFLAASATLAASLRFSPLAHAQAVLNPSKAPTYCFMDESGSCGEWPLVIGLLIAKNPENHSANLSNLRRSYSFYKTLEYSANDRAKVGFAKGVINYFQSQSDLIFRAIIVANKSGNFPEDNRERDYIYQGKYRRLLESSIPPTISNVEIIVQNRIPPSRDQRLQDFLGRLQWHPTIRHTNPVREELVQLTGFLAGCVRGEITETRSSVKTKLIDHFRRTLNAPRLRTVATEKISILSVEI